MSRNLKEARTKILRFEGYTVKLVENLNKPSVEVPGTYEWDVVSITYYFAAKLLEKDGTLAVADKVIIDVTDEIRDWLIEEIEGKLTDEKINGNEREIYKVLKKSPDDKHIREQRKRSKDGLSDIYIDDFKSERKCERNDICNVEKKIDLENAIKKLPQKQREVFYYRRIQDMLADDVSKILKVKKSAISRGETRAKAELRKLLPGYGG